MADAGHVDMVGSAVAAPDPGPVPRRAPILDFRLLGPLSVTAGGRPIELPGTRTRALLALLLIQANHVISADRLIEDLWAGEPTPGAAATLQGYVSELRKALADATGQPAPVLTKRPGYRITVEADQVDVLRFERLVERARAALHDGGSDVAGMLREALGLWRGPALADLADEAFAAAFAARLDETRLWALEERVDAELRADDHHELATELARLVETHPLRERLWGQWMLALYRCGRQAEALRAYQVLRNRLDEELAIEPSPPLQRLERAILMQDPSLEPPSTTARPPVREQASRSPLGGPALPVHLTRFVGRSRELDEARRLLSGGRLLSLAGSGGSGKTRLAVQLATELASGFGDGVRFIDLATVTEAAQVPAALATALGLDAQGADAAALCDHIADDNVLLLFDNCEHLVEATAALVESLLSCCAGVKVLATTQEQLNIWGETVLRVPSLSLPPTTEQASTEDLLASEAVQLFLDRATLADVDFSYDRTTLEYVAQICRSLDGIPLAVELAAGLVSVLAPAEIVRRLDDRFALLTRGSRRAVRRQTTLRAAIDWSYELLSGSERALFERLSVFVGDFSVTAAAAVGGPEADFLGDLSALVGKSMVTTVPGPAGTRRYRLLDTLRQYGLGRLQASNGDDEARRRHAGHYCDFAVAADRELHGHDAADWSTRLVQELPNLRAALDWCFSAGDLEVGVELAGALRWWFFGRMGALTEARSWLETALERQDALSPRLRLKAMVALMTVAFSQGDYRWASDRGDEAVSLAQDLDDHRELAVALMARGGAAVFEGKPERAVECLGRSLVYCDELGDRWGRAWVLTFWAVASRHLGDTVVARAQLDEALSIFRASRDDHNQVIPLIQLAMVAQQTGDLDAATLYCDDAIALARRLGDRQLAHGALCISGRVQLARGRTSEATGLLIASLRSFRGAENHLVVALAVEGLAIVAQEEERDADSARLWGYSAQLRSVQAMPLTDARLVERERYLARARARIGDEEVARLLNAGRAMSLAEVLGQVGPLHPAPAPDRGL